MQRIHKNISFNSWRTISSLYVDNPVMLMYTTDLQYFPPLKDGNSSFSRIFLILYYFPLCGVFLCTHTTPSINNCQTLTLNWIHKRSFALQGPTVRLERSKINREFIHKYLIKQRREKWFKWHLGSRGEVCKKNSIFKVFVVLSIKLNGF